VEKITLYLGTRKGEKDIASQLELPDIRDSGIQGDITHLFTEWTERPCYQRFEASSCID